MTFPHCTRRSHATFKTFNQRTTTATTPMVWLLQLAP